MIWLIILAGLFAALHLALMVPVQLAIMAAAISVAGLWIVWKLKWVILAIFGLEEIFGGRGNGA